jgi:hypothetical protein
MNFYIRTEGLRAIREWIRGQDVELDRVSGAYEKFVAGLQRALAVSFSSVGLSVELVALHLETQRKIFQEKFADEQLIILDPCLPSTAILQISRYYRPLSTTSHEHGPRPGTPSIEAQINDIKPGTYDVFNDD